ncbi:MAG TPA: UDP-2,3-diacylglucosamine diphosphatase [Rhodocyclaceae bacterium]|nr:UDP-2,3-diacylglucosamine diphosphatase [Rhodocyclaceae bacterium]
MPAALFVSDLHLCPTRPAIAQLFADFLVGPAAQAGAIYILGDLFEYWAGDDDLDEPFNAKVAAALKRLAERGTRLFLIRGNRDFLIGPDFSRASGVSLLDEPHRVIIAGTPTLLLHGDTLCTDDIDYQRFRDRVRSQSWRDDFLAQPLAERRAQIEALRDKSEAEKRVKAAAIMDVNDAAVAGLLRANGYPRLIHGHTHRRARHELLVDGHRCERWVLGDWYEGGSYLAGDEQGCRALPWPPAA